jgi:hypothetical protein
MNAADIILLPLFAGIAAVIVVGCIIVISSFFNKD